MFISKDHDTRGVQLDPELLALAAATPPLDLVRAFGKAPDPAAVARPIELEIGMGKGTFLIQEAALRPETDFIGLEYDRKIHNYAADRMRRRSLENVRTYWGDAGPFVRTLLPSTTFAAVHVYFPDPWPKTRHHKRRLLQVDFIRELERILLPGGELRIVTDHPGYAEHIGLVLEQHPMPQIPYTPPASAGPGELVGTNFERKYKKRDGRPSYAFARRRALAQEMPMPEHNSATQDG